MNLPINQIIKVIYHKIDESHYRMKLIIICKDGIEYEIIEVSDKKISSGEIIGSKEVIYVAKTGNWEDIYSYLEINIDVYKTILLNGVLKK